MQVIRQKEKPDGLPLFGMCAYPSTSPAHSTVQRAFSSTKKCSKFEETIQSKAAFADIGRIKYCRTKGCVDL
jgi:hypothetical protein